MELTLPQVVTKFKVLVCMLVVIGGRRTLRRLRGFNMVDRLPWLFIVLFRVVKRPSIMVIFLWLIPS